MTSEMRGDTGSVVLRPSMALGGGQLLMILHVLAGMFFFAHGLQSLIDAWQVPEYSHGPIIPMLSAYMFLREMKSVRPVAGPITDRWPGVVIVLAALGIGLLGLLVRIPDIVTYGMIVWIFGTILTLFGARRGWYFWPSVLHLVFMLPLPQFIYWPVSIWLQLVSSKIGVEFIQLMGVPVFLSGNVIDLGIYQLQVAEACSGLRYLFPVMSFSYVFGVLYTGPWWHKVVLLLSAAPITVLMNSFRIGVIGVMVDNFGISYAEGFLHLFEGWVIFISCVLILFGMAALMQRLQKNPKPLPDTIDLNFDGLGEQLRRFTAIPVSRGLVLAAALSTVAAVGWALAPERARVIPERVALAAFPSEIGAWRSIDRRIEDNVLETLAADDLLARAYGRSGGPGVDLLVVYYDKLTEGSGIHSPEVCIPAGGWEVSAWRPDRVPLGGPDDAVIEVNRAIISSGRDRSLVYYWFDLHGRNVTSDYAAKFYTVYDSLTKGRTDGALVRLITPIQRGETEAQAAERLKEMMQLAVPQLRPHLPD
ncbi:MAG: VPLPA-CTERM-specific exosortase XrtD [Pikeienuella sp.]